MSYVNIYKQLYFFSIWVLKFFLIRKIYERLDIAVTDLIELDPNEQLTIEEM